MAKILKITTLKGHKFTNSQINRQEIKIKRAMQILIRNKHLTQAQKDSQVAQIHKANSQLFDSELLTQAQYLKQMHKYYNALEMLKEHPIYSLNQVIDKNKYLNTLV